MKGRDMQRVVLEHNCDALAYTPLPTDVEYVNSNYVHRSLLHFWYYL
jgi:hypothetical protein